LPGTETWCWKRGVEAPPLTAFTSDRTSWFLFLALRGAAAPLKPNTNTREGRLLCSPSGRVVSISRRGRGDDACTDSGSSVQLGGAQPAGLIVGAVCRVSRDVWRGCGRLKLACCCCCCTTSRILHFIDAPCQSCECSTETHRRGTVLLAR